MANKRLFQVDVHYACFGIESEDCVVTLAAPIANWMIGKTLQQIKPWLLAKKAIVIEVNNQINKS